MNTLTPFRHVYFLFIIFFVFNSAMLLAQPYHATPLDHPGGTLDVVAINNNGQIAATLTDTVYFYYAIRREADGQFTPLTESGTASFAYGMNELGYVLAKILDESFVWHTVVWENTEMRELESPENMISVIPVNVNNSGIATGYILDTTYSTKAVVWDVEGGLHYLPDMDGTASNPSAINESDEIVGTIFQEDGWSRAILWQPNDTGYVAVDLGTLGGFGALATDINNNGQIVGYSYPEVNGFNVHAFFWDNNEMIDMGTLGGENSYALAITDDAFIVGASQDSMSGKTNSNYNSDLITWQKFLEKSYSGNIFGQSIPEFRSKQGTADTRAFYTKMHKNRQLEYDTPRLTPFSENIDISANINDVTDVNLSRAVLGKNNETEQQYRLENFMIRHIDPATMEQGYPGRSYDRYGTIQAALTDNIQNLPKIQLFALANQNYTNLTTPESLRVSVESFSGSGPSLLYGVPGSSINIADVVASAASSLYLSYSESGVVETERVTVSGKLSAGYKTEFKIAETLTINGMNAFAKGYFQTGPAAKISLMKGFIRGRIQINNPGFETDLVGRNNAAPGTGIIEGGSRFSSILGKLSRPVNSATGENGGYAFQLSLRNGWKYTPFFVFRSDPPAEPHNVTIEAVHPDSEPMLHHDNLNIGDLLINQINARYEMHIEASNGGKKSLAQQTFTSTIRVGVDSIDITDDPNRYRLLLFGFDGEFISEAGSFVPYDGSQPTSAVYTGFIDSILNVSARDVTITDSVILVLASGDNQTDITPDNQSDIIKTFELAQNFPNPFNPTTQIRYQVPAKSQVRLIIYNMLGQPVRTLIDEQKTRGVYSQTWDTRNEAGQLVASGIYMYRIEAKSEHGDQFIKTRKMVLIR